MKKNVIECKFSLLDEGRKYSGQHRKYVIENAREICYSPETKERIKLREALGYYGHGRRVLCGKMNLQEVDVMTLPDGTQAMVSNVPSNVTLKFDVSKDGEVTHSQEILDTETGKIVSSLHASKIGGFSWACPGTDGGESKATTLTGFSGFDYVLQPGFSANRGYVLENAGNTAQLILESVSSIVKDDKRAEQLVAGWKWKTVDNRLNDLEDALFESEGKYATLKEQNDEVKINLAKMALERDNAIERADKAERKFKGILESLQEKLPFFIPASVMQEILEGDFKRAKMIFEQAAVFDYSSLPIGKTLPKLNPAVPLKREEPEYGSAAYGFSIKL